MGYIVTQVPAGYLAERFSATRILGVAMGLTSVLSCLTASAARAHLYALVAVRFLEGLCEVSARCILNWEAEIQCGNSIFVDSRYPPSTFGVVPLRISNETSTPRLFLQVRPQSHSRIPIEVCAKDIFFCIFPRTSENGVVLFGSRFFHRLRLAANALTMQKLKQKDAYRTFSIGVPNQGVTFPCVFIFVSKWIPVQERGLILNLILIGNSVGTFLTMIGSAILCDSSLGWPASFYVFGERCGQNHESSSSVPPN